MTFTPTSNTYFKKSKINIKQAKGIKLKAEITEIENRKTEKVSEL